MSISPEQMTEINAMADFIFSDIPFLTDLFHGPLHPCYCGQYKGECEWDHEWAYVEYDPSVGMDGTGSECAICGLYDPDRIWTDDLEFYDNQERN